MAGRFVRHCERVLTADGRRNEVRFRDAVFAIVWGGVAYGALMGSFAGLTVERWPQMLYSAVKVPFLLMATTCLAMPSFFVLNSLVGLRNDFAEAMRAVAVTQGVVGIVLASLSPLTAVWYRTSSDYHEATIFNGVMFFTASLAAQWVLRKRYAPLINRHPRHRLMLRFWLVVYAFVGIQMGWTLRPFVGDPATPPSFIRTETWGNAYLILPQILWRAVSR